MDLLKSMISTVDDGLVPNHQFFASASSVYPSVLASLWRLERLIYWSLLSSSGI